MKKELLRLIQFTIMIFICCLMCLCTLLAFMKICDSKYDYRDVNKDGKVSTQDISIIKAYIQERNNENGY
jgi:hypothetical protein